MKIKTYVSFLAIMACTLLIAGESAAKSGCAEPPKSSKPVELLLVTGGHPYEPSEFFAMFSALPTVHYQHVYMEEGKPIAFPPGGLGQYDVVLFYDQSLKGITPEWRSLFDRGRGIVFLHHALGSFPDSPEYRAIVGGRYKYPSERNPDLPHSSYHMNERQHFTIVDRSHPITCAIADFDMLDEAYDGLEIDPGSHILMKSDFPKRTPAAAWISSYAQKRVAYIQPGHGSAFLPPDHGPSSYQNESFKRLLERAILWSAGRI